MASISKQIIVERVARFVEYVRSSDSSINLGFQPNTHWWISHQTPTISHNFPNAFSFTEQIGVSTQDMKDLYGRYWPSKLGVDFFQTYFHQTNFKQTVCFTVLSADMQRTEIAPNEKNNVGGVFQETRHSKSPWHKLRDAICGTTNDTPTCIPPKKKRKVDSILEQVVDYNSNNYYPISFKWN
jgi:hypothetical protein